MILNNPWVVGISGGILSGLFVAIITRVLFSRRDKREYVQKLQLANSEVLYAIRPGVSEGLVPQKGVVESLIQATARKYNVDKVDMFDINDLADELVKEVMDSSFISAKAKNDFCDKLTAFKELKRQKEIEGPEVLREYEIMSKYRRQTVTILSMMVGILTAIMGVVATFQIDKVNNEKQILLLALPAVIAVLVALALRIIKDFKAEAIKLKLMGAEIVFRQRKDKDAKQSHSPVGKQRHGADMSS